MSNASATATQPSILDGNPFPSALALFLFQVVIITSLSRFLSYFLGKIRQPAVIAEMIAGILLGPSALSRIPSFQDLIFPSASVKIIQVISQFGLVIFMFLVGVELDVSDFRDSLKQVSIIAIVGVVVPCVIAVPASLPINSPEYSRTTFVDISLFTGVAIGMSALPVLARILAERNMLRSRLGQMVMGATSVDDVIAWCLLAVVVAIVRASSQLNILYTVLLALLDLVVVVYVVRPLLNHLCRKVETKSDVTPHLFFAVILVLLCTSYLTEVIGLSALIGAFQIGLILPRKRALVTGFAQKLEDLIVIILMPLFFTNSGLRTNFFLLSSARDWGLVVYFVVVATGSKVLAIFVPARLFGLGNRDSLAFGILMSCKGLVALIVVNFGLDYEIITPKLFSIFVVMVLITSLLTVPLTELVLPLSLFHRPPSQPEEASHKAEADEEQSLVALEAVRPLSNAPSLARNLKGQDLLHCRSFRNLSMMDPQDADQHMSIVIRVLVCATNRKNSAGLVSLANALVKTKGGDPVPGSECFAYRPLSNTHYLYIHSLAAVTDLDDVMSCLVERANMHQLQAKFLPIPVLPSDVPSQALGIVYANRADVLILPSTFSTDLQETQSQLASMWDSFLQVLIRSHCITAVLVDSKEGWPVSNVRRALVVLCPGKHGAVAVHFASVLATNGVEVTAVSVPSLPHDQTISEWMRIQVVAGKTECPGTAMKNACGTSSVFSFPSTSSTTSSASAALAPAAVGSTTALGSSDVAVSIASPRTPSTTTKTTTVPANTMTALSIPATTATIPTPLCSPLSSLSSPPDNSQSQARQENLDRNHRGVDSGDKCEAERSGCPVTNNRTQASLQPFPGGSSAEKGSSAIGDTKMAGNSKPGGSSSSGTTSSSGTQSSSLVNSTKSTCRSGESSGNESGGSSSGDESSSGETVCSRRTRLDTTRGGESSSDGSRRSGSGSPPRASRKSLAISGSNTSHHAEHTTSSSGVIGGSECASARGNGSSSGSAVSSPHADNTHRGGNGSNRRANSKSPAPPHSARSFRLSSGRNRRAPSIPESDGTHAQAVEIVKVIENECKVAAQGYSLIIVPDLFVEGNNGQPPAPNTAPLHARLFRVVAGISDIAPLLLVRAPGVSSLAGSFVLGNFCDRPAT